MPYTGQIILFSQRPHQGTLPTLYFQDAAGNQGRLQTSSHGQTAFARIAPVEVHTARVFLPTAAVQTQFLQDFAATNGSREALERVKLSYVGCGWPKVGCYVVEVKFAGPEPDRETHRYPQLYSSRLFGAGKRCSAARGQRDLQGHESCRCGTVFRLVTA